MSTLYNDLCNRTYMGKPATGTSNSNGAILTRVQNTRENFKSSRDDIQALMRKMLEVRQTVSDSTLVQYWLEPAKHKMQSE